MSARTERLAFLASVLHTPGVRAFDVESARNSVLIGGLVASDVLATAISFWAAYLIRFQLRVTVAPEVVPPADLYAGLFLVLIPVWILLFAFNGLYRMENLLGGTFEYAKVFHACSVGMMLVVTATFFQPTFVVSRGWLVSAWLLTILQTCFARFCIRRIVYALRRYGYFSIPVLVVGSNGETAALAEQLSEERKAGYRVVGIVKVNASDAEIEPNPGGHETPLLGSTEDIVQIIQQHRVREVIVAASSMQKEQLLAMFERIQPLKGVEMHLSTGLYEVLATGVDLKMAANVPLVRLNRLRLRPMEAVMKAVFEWSVTSFLVIAGAPLLVAVAAMVKATSPGPILHRRRVLGVGGREFDAFKFRTMRVDGEQVLDAMPELKRQLQEEGKLRADPRITPIGHFLRRYSLDELPQLFNVLRGEMSLVGPRMITAGEAAKYGAHRANLLTVRPGLTGLWQVSGRSELNYAQRVRLDMHYIRHYSIWRDIQILFVHTPGAVLRGRGAY